MGEKKNHISPEKDHLATLPGLGGRVQKGVGEGSPAGQEAGQTADGVRGRVHQGNHQDQIASDFRF